MSAFCSAAIRRQSRAETNAVEEEWVADPGKGYFRHGTTVCSSRRCDATGRGTTTMSERTRPQINRKHPAYLLFLVDQSGSMQEELADAGGESKAEFLAKTINRSLNIIIKACTRSQGDDVEVRHYFDISVLGYGNPTVASALGGVLAGKPTVGLPELADHPVRVETRKIKQNNGNGGIVELDERVPVWLDPVSGLGTPMAEALQEAQRLASDWVAEHPDSYPPIVLHITDGEATTGDPAPAAAALRDLSTSHGGVLLLNCHIASHGSHTVLYPVDESEVPVGDPYATALFGMSSELRPEMVELAREAGHVEVKTGSRGYVFNGGMADLVDFLSIGTIQTQAVRQDR